MAWKNVPAENEELLDRHAGVLPGAEKLKMFGCPVYTVNGNMFAGAHREDIFLRLSEPDHDAVFEIDGIRPFEPMPGRVMREYVVVPAPIYQSGTEFPSWLARA